MAPVDERHLAKSGLARPLVARTRWPSAETTNQQIPIEVKGLGEVGIVGVAAAIANAVFHATGKRVRDLPITLEELL
jgi:CO/xanthine dehydrogenase Mo-binding subunit